MKQKPLIPAAVTLKGCWPPSAGTSSISKPIPAPQSCEAAPTVWIAVPDVHNLPPELVNGLSGFGVVTVEQGLIPSSQSLYMKNDPWMPTELLPAAT